MSFYLYLSMHLSVCISIYLSIGLCMCNCFLFIIRLLLQAVSVHDFFFFVYLFTSLDCCRLTLFCSICLFSCMFCLRALYPHLVSFVHFSTIYLFPLSLSFNIFMSVINFPFTGILLHCLFILPGTNYPSTMCML